MARVRFNQLLTYLQYKKNGARAYRRNEKSEFVLIRWALFWILCPKPNVYIGLLLSIDTSKGS